MFADDRDLLFLEPMLFRDAGWLGQTLARGTASATGTILSAFENDFVSAGVGAGHVLVLGGASYEVVERLSAVTLRISRLRADVDGPELPVQSVTDAEMRVVTFEPQLAVVHRQLLHMLGLSESPGDGELGESAVTNPEDLRRIEVLGALHLVYSAASSAGDPGGAWAMRARMYRDRFGAERHRVAAEIDSSGDGGADAMRRLNVSRFVRV